MLLGTCLEISLHHAFLCKGWIISCIINATRQYSADLIQGGLEVPCCLIFQGSPQDLDKMKKMLQDVPKGQLKELEVEEEEQTKELAKKQAPVQKQFEPDQRNTRKHCVLEQPNIQTLKIPVMKNSKDRAKCGRITTARVQEI